jgi:hypothetical protein
MSQSGIPEFARPLVHELSRLLPRRVPPGHVAQAGRSGRTGSRVGKLAPMIRHARTLALCAATAAVVASCGSDDSGGGGSGPDTPTSGAAGAGGSATGGSGGLAGAPPVGGTGGGAGTPQPGGAGGVSGAAGTAGTAGEGGTSGAGGRLPVGTPATDADLGPNVLIFDPSVPDIQQQIDAVSDVQVADEGQFGPQRYALLLKPGAYTLDIRVGYYMQVLGVGQSPDDVVITGQVRSNDRTNGTALSCFWRAAENVAVDPSGGSNLWAVSQAAPMRRTHILGDLALSEGGHTSGGLLADSIVDGQVRSGTQQQWLSRNTEWAAWAGGVWNMVFVGAVNPPGGAWPGSPYTVIDTTPRVREKPYLFLADDDTNSVMIPDLLDDSLGASWAAGPTPGTAVSTAQFQVAQADVDNAATLNAALREGWNLLFTPGVYQLDDTL